MEVKAGVVVPWASSGQAFRLRIPALSRGNASLKMTEPTRWENLQDGRTDDGGVSSFCVGQGGWRFDGLGDWLCRFVHDAAPSLRLEQRVDTVGDEPGGDQEHSESK